MTFSYLCVHCWRFPFNLTTKNIHSNLNTFIVENFETLLCRAAVRSFHSEVSQKYNTCCGSYFNWTNFSAFTTELFSSHFCRDPTALFLASWGRVLRRSLLTESAVTGTLFSNGKFIGDVDAYNEICPSSYLCSFQLLLGETWRQKFYKRILSTYLQLLFLIGTF